MPRPNAPGWLVVLEGIDGAGKSTVLRRLAEYCETKGLATVSSGEPTRGPWGMKLRQSMVDGRLTLEEELELFLKDRAEHVETVIRPALEAGKVVLLDRYYLSTAAYQGARGADPDAILARNESFAPQPDLVLLLDFEPAAGLDRIRARGDAPNTFEELDQLKAVRRIFLSLDRPFIRKVDAARPANEVVAACCALLDAAFAADR
jgi:dTMP kinase